MTKSQRSEPDVFSTRDATEAALNARVTRIVVDADGEGVDASAGSEFSDDRLRFEE